MLRDEERESIEWLKRLVKLNKRDNLDDTFAEILLNLIEKQSKEIEELKEKNKYIEDRAKIGKNIQTFINKDYVKQEYISKDKIKAFIKEELPDDEICSCCEIFDINGIDLKRKLQSLLEDNTEDNTEDIKETNLHYVTCESHFKNMHIVKLLNEFFEENNLIVNELVRAVNKIRRNKQC